MNCKSIIINTIAFSLTFLMWSCNKEDTISNTQHSFDNDKYQIWFEYNIGKTFELKLLINEKEKSIIARPYWNEAAYSETKNYIFIEIPIETKGVLGIALQDSQRKWQQDKDSKYLNSLTKIIVRENKTTNEKIVFLMSIIGDKDYLESRNFSINHNSYLAIDKDFSGYVLYHSMNNQYING